MSKVSSQSASLSESLAQPKAGGPRAVVAVNNFHHEYCKMLKVLKFLDCHLTGKLEVPGKGQLDKTVCPSWLENSN